MKRVGYVIFIISLTLAIMISLAFFFLSYKPNQDELMRVKHKVQGLKSDIKIQEGSIERTRDAIAHMKLGSVNLNYFERTGVSGEEKTPYFLRILNNLANTLGIRFVSIVPVAAEKKNGYVKEAFEIHVRSDFDRLFHLLFQIQNTLGLNIDRLNIDLVATEPVSDIAAKIQLNSLELIEKKDRDPRNLEDLRAFHLESELKLKDIKLQKPAKVLPATTLALFREEHRDPFVKPVKIREIQERLKQAERELKASQLLGIIDFSGQRHAIIGKNTVKKGDRIFNMDVLEITHDQVILGSDEIRFTYSLKKDKNP